MTWSLRGSTSVCRSIAGSTKRYARPPSTTSVRRNISSRTSDTLGALTPRKIEGSKPLLSETGPQGSAIKKHRDDFPQKPPQRYPRPPSKRPTCLHEFPLQTSLPWPHQPSDEFYALLAEFIKQRGDDFRQIASLRHCLSDWRLHPLDRRRRSQPTSSTPCSQASSKRIETIRPSTSRRLSTDACGM